MDLIPANFPEWQEAIEREQFVRDSAFLGLSETVAGFELRPLTLRTYLLLRVSRCPVVCGGEITDDDLCKFLWLCSTDYRPDPRAAKRFYRTKCRKFRRAFAWTRAGRGRERLRVELETMEAKQAAVLYSHEAMMDSPANSGSAGHIASYYSDAAYLCAGLAREYGFDYETVLDMPLKQIFQFLNERKEHSGSKQLFNPSDRTRRECVDRFLKK